MNQSIYFAESLLNCRKSRLDAVVVGNVAFDQTFFITNQPTDTFFHTFVLVGVDHGCSLFFHRLSTSPRNRALVGHAHDDDLLIA